jgi:hypothetical protein
MKKGLVQDVLVALAIVSFLGQIRCDDEPTAPDGAIDAGGDGDSDGDVDGDGDSDSDSDVDGDSDGDVDGDSDSDGDGDSDVDGDGDGDGDFLDILVPYVESLTIDGDLSGWPVGGCRQLDSSHYHELGGATGGDSDLSARVCLAWSREHLYLSAEVTDEVQRNAEGADTLWAGDSLQVALDTDHDRTAGSYDDDDDYEYGFAQVASGATVRRFHAPAGAEERAHLAFARVSPASRYELSIPWCDLTSLHGGDGEHFGLSFLINDDDGSGREGWIEWTPGIGQGKDPSALGQARLTGGPGGEPLDCDDEPLPEGSFYGINTHLPNGSELVTQYDLVRDAGIGWVRVDFSWFLAEPSRDRYEWSAFDEVARAAEARGLLIFATLAYSPGWANGGREGRFPPSDSDDWAEFCRVAAERYDGRHGLPTIRYWGMWNEPDIDTFFVGSADDYVDRVLIPGATAVREGNPDALICGPDLAHDESWLEEVLSRSHGFIDVVTIHHYDQRARDYGDWLDGFRWPWDEPNIYRVLTNTGFLPGTPVWLTEAGWPTNAPWECWFDHIQSETDQAIRYPELLDELATRDWITRIFFYELRDADLDIACQWGILRGDMTPKPAYFAYRDYITTHPR